MPLFIWEAVTKKNELKKGEMEAADEITVRGLLRRQGFKSIEVKKKPKDLMEYLPFLKGKIKEKEGEVKGKAKEMEGGLKGKAKETEGEIKGKIKELKKKE